MPPSIGDLTGRVFNRYTVVRFDRVDNRCKRWWCVCRCSPEIERSVYQHQLLLGRSGSCGCLKADLFKAGKYNVTHGASGTPEHIIWSGMRARCQNKNHTRYGGRGIAVCDRWLESFENFLEDMGPRPPGMTIDRKNNDLGYSKDNCRWATNATQAQNRSTTKLTEADVLDVISALHEGGTRRELADLFDVSEATIKDIKMRRSWVDLHRPWPQGDDRVKRIGRPQNAERDRG